MPYDIFVSHSTKDKLVADAVVAHLEQSGLRCWCAPRDIVPGASWASSIVDGIAACKAMVVVFSTHANASDHIRREVERAVGHGIPVVPVRIEDVMPQGDLEYFLSSSHWMDAIHPPLDRHFDQLAKQLHALMSVGPTGPKIAALTGAGRSPDLETPSKRRAAWWIAGVVAILALVGIGIWAMHRSGQNGNAVALNRPVSPPVSGTDHSSSENKSTVVPVPAPAPAPSPVQPPTPTPVQLPTPTPAQPATPTPAPSPVKPLDSSTKASLAHDIETWGALSKAHWENSFFLENGPTHYPIWRTAADAGDPTAQFFVGFCYAQGAGVKADDAVALQWFTKSAEAGNTDAMIAIGLRALEGQGGPVDPPTWYFWMKKAADRDDIGGMAFLGFGLFAQGEPGNQAEGRRLLQISADKGSGDAGFLVAGTLGLSPADFSARLQTLAAKGQPDSMLLIANSNPQDPANMEMGRRATKIFGNPLELERLIDPPPMFFFNTSGAFTRIAWERLHEMADGGYTTAAETITRLKSKGFKDPVASPN